MPSIRCAEHRPKRLKEIDNPDGATAVETSRYPLLKNPWDLFAKEWDKLASIQKHNAPLYRAYLLKERLAAVFEETTHDDAERELKGWLAWASRSELKPFVKAVRTIRKHKEGILAYFSTKLTNGLVEGFNNKLRMFARRAFGACGRSRALLRSYCRFQSTPNAGGPE